LRRGWPCRPLWRTSRRCSLNSTARDLQSWRDAVGGHREALRLPLHPDGRLRRCDPEPVEAAKRTGKLRLLLRGGRRVPAAGQARPRALQFREQARHERTVAFFHEPQRLATLVMARRRRRLRHEVTLPGFWLGRYPVMVGQYGSLLKRAATLVLL
jgi:hypothetical protein